MRDADENKKHKVAQLNNRKKQNQVHLVLKDEECVVNAQGSKNWRV